MITSDLDPIVAVATAPGLGAIGVVRVSGKAISGLLLTICRRELVPRHATYLAFYDEAGQVIDRGLALHFPAPHSYTGEEVIEFQVHGGPVVLRLVLERCLSAGRDIGLRLAEPGEFTRRALLNDKLDLAQAEAVADLIEASTEAAARSAQESLSGMFSQAIAALIADLIRLRMLIEATLDFPEEEIDFLERADAHGQLGRIVASLAGVIDRSTQGALLRSGIKVVLAGRPNVGKSSLLNALAQAEIAIVTPIAGTTRDRISQAIQIEGIALHIVDTAGLRESEDEVERIGIEKTWQEIAAADLILILRDTTDDQGKEDEAIAARLPEAVPRLIVMNKVDLTGRPARIEDGRVHLSARTGEGLELLRGELLRLCGWHANSEPVFLARARHLDALRAAERHLKEAQLLVEQGDRALDLLAEELRLAQSVLGQITSPLSADDLLGEIFSRFCIGK